MVALQLAPGPISKLNAPKSSLGNMVSFSPKVLSEDPDPAELQGMEENIEALMLKGDDPATRLAVKHMTDFLVKTMIPHKEKQLRNDQKDLDDRSNQIKECSVQKKRESDMNFHEKMSKAEEHKAVADKGMAEVGHCLNVEEAKKLVKDAHCHDVHDHEKKCMCHSDLVKATGRSPECKEETVNDPAHKTCCDKFAAHGVHQLKCRDAKYEMQYAQRQGAIIMEGVCNEYSACYDKQQTNYKYAEQKAKAHEAHGSLKTLYTIKCLVKTFEGGKVTEKEVKACKEEKHDVTPIKYPETVAKESCTVPQGL